MDLYQTPGGKWCGTQADWAKAMKAEGFNPSQYTGRRAVSVPTKKNELLEFLTFYDVMCIAPRQPVEPIEVTAPPAHTPDTVDTTPRNGVPADLDTMFLAAPLGQQLTLAALACEEAYKRVK